MGFIARMECPVCGHKREFIIGRLYSDWMTEEDWKEGIAAGEYGELLRTVLGMEDEDHVFHVEAERDAYCCEDCGEVFEAQPFRFRLETRDGRTVLSDRQRPKCPNCGSYSSHEAAREEFWRCICGAVMEDKGIDWDICID